MAPLELLGAAYTSRFTFFPPGCIFQRRTHEKKNFQESNIIIAPHKEWLFYINYSLEYIENK